MTEMIFKITDFTDMLKEYLENSNTFKNVNVKGEVANLTLNKTGHIYFSLKDSQAKIDCAIWKTNASVFTNLNIREGTEVIARGSLSYYKPTGKITFIVYDVRVDGVGELALLYDKRYKELQEQGWFLDEFKKPITKFPNNIGIVTAATGDAIKDLITTIKRRYPPVNIFLFPSLVQGDGAAKDIAKKIKQANNFKIKIDTLIVGRGGGSYEDLWSFNEMEVLQAIKESEIPVISGVGHEPDITLADYVSDFRASTPTAAGEKATPDTESVLQALSTKTNDFAKVLKNKIEKIIIEVDNFSAKLQLSIKSKFNQMINNFKNTSINFNSIIINKLNFINTSFENNILIWKKSLANKLEKNIIELKTYEEKIELQSPYLPLSKGYSILKQENKVIRSVKDVSKNQLINAVLKDGTVNFKLEEGNE
ncbi:exodeoxyribonuclease VII large subunit [Spiroplasma cantharicola]|uniref:Exodeoxyribonuclease 7 large subunit n=1 Tax=Spiroplasma cantharicola TaxID=362837 RepID=A0A0M4KEJ8_9MOLU|nr:exodeoxyribonuclease VII large subunit [Spiroplasma cantharicola]ALD66432.1 exodeoxyribonuclease VII large subunit [Spiroplasma cantharicola]